QVLAMQHQQQELARQAEAARRRAQQEAAAQTDAARRAQALQRQRAYDQLVAQAGTAQRQGNYRLAVQSWESALALQPSDGARRELAQAKSLAEKVAQAQAAQAQARKESEIQRQREAD